MFIYVFVKGRGSLIREVPVNKEKTGDVIVELLCLMTEPTPGAY